MGKIIEFPKRNSEVGGDGKVKRGDSLVENNPTMTKLVKVN